MDKCIIINADDCGKNQEVNAEIEKSILLGKITSTTIMANMDDFDGAVQLYKKYGNQISFGWHINLDEGPALTNSQLLLDKGFFVEREGKIYLNGGKYKKSFFNAEMRNEIKKELRNQWQKLRDNGIDISHADSHHYYHTQPCMISIIPSLFKELRIKRCRHISNYGVYGINRMLRSLWADYFKFQGIKMPDTFCFFKDYYKDSSLKQGDVVELMIHPGHPSAVYEEEYELMLDADYNSIWPKAKLITYKEI